MEKDLSHHFCLQTIAVVQPLSFLGLNSATRPTS
jgi:hypothetical protein